MLLRKIEALAGKKKTSVSEQVWDLCERGLQERASPRAEKRTVSLPSADLGRVLVNDREDLYGNILSDRL
jgi:hypothetical protein